MRTKRGQALMELAAGMFALTLVVSMLCGFAVYIAKSLAAQNALRASSGGSNAKSDTVAVEAFAAKYVFGKETLKIKEKVALPSTEL